MDNARRALSTAREWSQRVTLFGGSAFASQPDSEPMCGNLVVNRASRSAPGDNGSAGCQGILIADEANGDNAEDAMDLVTDILSVGPEGECGDDQLSDRAGR